MNQTIKNFHIAIRILLGMFFIGSAITKLISIDSFEVFIYSLGFLNLDLSFFAARIVISFEIFIGVLLLTRTLLRLVIPATITLLVLFTLFITYLIMFDSDRHCFCFGDLLEISNHLSIAKNLVLIILMLIISPTADFNTKYKKLIVVTSLIVSMAITFILSPPDTFYYKHYSENVTYDQLLLQGFLDDNPDLKDNRRILCFFGTGCRFCKLAVQKITVIAEKTDKADKISCIFLGNESAETAIQEFYQETNSHDFQYTSLPPEIFIRITKGEMPLIILLDEGITKGKYDYRSINERQFIDFLNK